MAARNTGFGTGRMTRRQFLRTAGIAGGAVAAAGLGLSGVARASGAMGYAQPRVGLFYHTTATGDIWKQSALVAKAVLDEAGVMATLVPMPQSKELVRDALMQGGFNAVIGFNVSASAARLADGMTLYGAPLQYLEAIATADDMNPLYPGSKYTMPPMHFHRTAVTSSQWGAALAQEFQNSLVPLPVNKAFVVRSTTANLTPNGPDPLDPFGLQAKDGFDYILGVSQLIVMNTTGTQYKVGDGAGTIYASPPLSGQWLVGSALDSNNAVNLVKAIKTTNDLVGNDLYLGTIGTVDSNINNDPTAKDFMLEKGIGVIAHHPGNPAYGGWQGWQSWNLGYSQVPDEVDHRLLRAFDAAWLLSNVMLYSHDMRSSYDLISRFSGPAGQVLYPYLNNLGAVSRRPDLFNLNFEGASGPIDFVDGECRTSWYRVWVNMGAAPYNFSMTTQ